MEEEAKPAGNRVVVVVPFQDVQEVLYSEEDARQIQSDLIKQGVPAWIIY
jgi:hypothetical protein